MSLRAVLLALGGLLAAVAPAAGNDAERAAMRAVRLTTEAAVVQSCTRLGSARDDSAKDLRRKIVRSGGNAALIVFGLDELSMMYADVYRCPATVEVPPGVPPPPAGTPPPPPPSR
jgi:hypothetical protein